jgi:uncharacterized membrane protein YfcA
MCQAYIAFGSLAKTCDEDVMSLDAIVMLFLGFLGVFAGFLGGLLGVGGGVIVVPILVLVFDLETRLAVGTSLVMIIFTALSATLAYSRQKRIDWKVGIMAAVATVPGASIGAYATKFFSSKSLAIIFGVALFFIAGIMLRRTLHQRTSHKKAHSAATTQIPNRGVWHRKLVDSMGKVFEYDSRIYSGLLLLFLGGLASGFLGIGGGLIVVPILSAIVGLPMHIAVATSMLTMTFTSISGVSTHIMLGNVRIEYAIPLVIGILLGAQLGARTAKGLKSASLERVFAVVVLVIGIVLIITRL